MILYGGDGKDKINLTKDVGEKITVDGGAGNDKITVSGGGSYSNHKIKGGAGNDTITVAKGNSVMRAKFNGDKGNDKFIVNAGIQHTFNGGAGADTFKINGGGAHTINTGGSKGTKKYDRVYIGKNYSSSVTVNGGAGNDTITVTGGSYSKVFGDYAYSSSGNATGHDRFYVKSGTGHEIFTGWGNDKVYVSGGSNIFIKNGINESHLFVGGDDAYSGNDRIEISGGKNIMFQGSQGTSDGKDYGAETIVITGGSGLDISTQGCADTITISSGTGKVNTGSGKNKVTFNWTDNVGDYFITADELLDDRIVINNAKSSDFIATRDIYTPLGYIDTTLGGHDYLIFTHKTTGATITLTGWSSGDETTYGAYFTGDKKIVFSTPGQSPMVEAARKTPGYSG